MKRKLLTTSFAQRTSLLVVSRHVLRRSHRPATLSSLSKFTASHTHHQSHYRLFSSSNELLHEAITPLSSSFREVTAHSTTLRCVDESPFRENISNTAAANPVEIATDKQQKRQQHRPYPERGPTKWISISSTPPFATLYDILLGVTQSMDYLRARKPEERPLRIPRYYSPEEQVNDNVNDSISSTQNSEEGSLVEQGQGETDTIPQQKQQQQPPERKRTPRNKSVDLNEYQQTRNLPPHMVIEARMILSLLKRPAGWYIRFPHALIAREFVRQSRNNDTPCRIGWKRVHPHLFYPNLNAATNRLWNEPVDTLMLDDTVVRVENVPWRCNDDTIRSFFRWYELADERGEGARPAVERVVEAKVQIGVNKPMLPKYHTYLVRFGDAAMARAAVRERHLVDLFGETLLLTQYPSQLLNTKK